MHAGIYAATFLVTAGLTGLIWRLAGAERAPRFIGLAFTVAFLFAWAVLVSPGWRAYDALGRLGHIVFGATIVGFIFDYLRPPRLVGIALLALFIVGVAWTEATGALFVRPDKTGVIIFIVLVLLGAALAWRVDRAIQAEVPVGQPGPGALILLIMTALALAAVGYVSRQASFGTTGIVLAATAAGFFPWIWMTGSNLPAAMLCPAAAGLFALAWGIADGTTAALPGVGLAALALFADGTARRVPLPKAGVSAILHPLLLASMALLPLALAVAVTLALRQPG
jgi:hypothetical protein